ncbi:MAG TPA: chitobiase/beta-hexosaminidase C-terminal domain-containing protein [Steroidobacteraceae bacterium]|nr:chitobiase/beta-hexosaminidase C-terminal domain-containing protein [Steroidobacteraceae bacterium]
MNTRANTLGGSLLALCMGMWLAPSAANAQQSVSLGSADNVYGLARPGTTITGGGIDGSGDAYSTDELGTSVAWSGQTFQFAAPGPGSALAARVVSLPAAQDLSLSILATAVEGNHPGQSFVVTYTDGSKTTFTQSLSDWHTPQHYAGEFPVITTAYKLLSNGTRHLGTYSLYGYTFLLNSAKTVQSLTLPNTKDVVVLALNVTPAGGSSPGVGVGLGSVDNLYGIANPGSTVTGGGIDGSGDAYPADQLGRSVSWSGQTFQLAAPGPGSAVTSQVIALPASKVGSLSFLGTGVAGNQPNQTFIVTYADGTKTSFTRGLSDWHTPQKYSGESLAASATDKILSTGAKHLGSYDLYGYTLTLDSTKTLKSLTLPSNRHVVLLALNVGTSSPSVGGTGPTKVNLGSLDNVYGIGTLGTAVTGGGIDGSGDAYPGNQLGSSVTWSGETFTLAPPGPNSVLTGKVIPLTAGHYASLSLLATAVEFDQPDQTFVVTYGDGTQGAFTQSLSDWHNPQQYPGESVAATTTYKVTSNGGQHATSAPYNLYGYSFPLDSSKTVVSLTLPSNHDVVVLAVDLSTTAVAAPHVAATPTFSVPGGAYSAPQSISLQDATPGATIYYTFDGSTPTTASVKYTGPIQVFGSATLSTLITTIKAIAVASGDTNSSVASATYTISLPVAATPAFVPSPSLPVASPLVVTITGPTPGEEFLYTLDGTTPSGSSLLTSGPIAGVVPNLVDLTQIQAIGVGAGLRTSPVASVTYNFAELPSDSLGVAGGAGAFLSNPNQASYGCTPQAIQSGACSPPAPGFVSCQYYRDVGLLPSGACDVKADPVDGHPYFTGGGDWLAAYQRLAGSTLTSGTGDITATFVNIMDLNFTRQHHAALFGPVGVPGVASAAYVCNSAGPDFYHSFAAAANPGASDPAITQAVDTAIDNAPPGPGDLPCVAIDYGLNPGAGQQAYMRFLAFDKNHRLLPAVDLDGRGLKEIPDACSACHGVPVNAPAPAGTALQTPGQASYIPFDEGNLLFSSSAPGLTQREQETNIWLLNQIVLNGQARPAGGSDPVFQLIHGWYDNEAGVKQQPYVPPDLQAALANPAARNESAAFAQADVSVYRQVYAPFCRSCHVANGVGAYAPPQTAGAQLFLFGAAGVCSPPGSPAIMPNSKVTFDRLWATHLNPPAYNVDFLQLLQTYFSAKPAGSPYTCALAAPPPKRHRF